MEETIGSKYGNLLNNLRHKYPQDFMYQSLHVYKDGELVRTFHLKNYDENYDLFGGDENSGVMINNMKMFVDRAGYATEVVMMDENKEEFQNAITKWNEESDKLTEEFKVEIGMDDVKFSAIADKHIGMLGFELVGDMWETFKHGERND